MSPRIYNYVLVPLSVVTLLACFGGTKQPQLTSLEKQALQTRTYEHSKEIVFNSTISVLQDLGYVIKSANKDTGIIFATSPLVQTSSGAQEFFLGTNEEQLSRCNAFVEALPHSTRLRLTFLLTTRTEEGPGAFDDDGPSWAAGRKTSKEQPVYDAKTYQDAFNLIEEAIFLRTPSPAPKRPPTPAAPKPSASGAS